MGRNLRAVIPHIVLMGIGLIWIYPFFWMLASSFKTNQEYLGQGLKLLPESMQWENYARAWEVANFSTYFANSVVLTVSTVIIVVVVCSMTGYALGRVDFFGKNVLIAIITATLFIPKGYTIIPVYQVVKGLGLLNTMPGVILAEAGGAHVLFILLFTTYFKGLPKELEESSEMDGSDFLRTFWSVMLPLSKPIIATVVVMQFMWTWNSFFTPLVFTLNNPSLRTLSVGIFSFIGEHSADYTGMAAAACISIIPIILVFILLQKYFVDGIAGAIKG
ncbi:carbohydrate ABC transporter permease [Paenibacillus alba]|uniref:Carbohydrate ABC transporter permease n=1 Tax=Paenibacillus alba TaxID=1197127 RepID=A0ABU6G7D7_9BACL|nr:carbohydrate ABC transporter permease [Paenibacillus alba]MEC0229544.1 carbohydrate ABC transporter permease [Paenibacillus alba]